MFGSLGLTAISSLLALIAILFHHKPSKKITNLCFFIVSLCFFLFSFHVHEKTILVPYIAYLLNMKLMPEVLPSFSTIALFSLYPLLKREGQVITYVILMILNIVYTKYLTKGLKLDWLNFIIVPLYHLLELTVKPPQNYPWLYPMINALVSFINFSFILLYSYYTLWKTVKINKKN
jgi:alpha-1,3-glucosyltransferase